MALLYPRIGCFQPLFVRDRLCERTRPAFRFYLKRRGGSSDLLRCSAQVGVEKSIDSATQRGDCNCTLRSKRERFRTVRIFARFPDAALGKGGGGGVVQRGGWGGVGTAGSVAPRGFEQTQHSQPHRGAFHQRHGMAARPQPDPPPPNSAGTPHFTRRTHGPRGVGIGDSAAKDNHCAQETARSSFGAAPVFSSTGHGSSSYRSGGPSPRSGQGLQERHATRKAR